ncbi:MAG: TetR/AcrR family transcriptional regulator [Rhizobiaceae bacterium]|nr:TetR/AcrR family transcriptional regulator [Rhizobiaceae bacterium]
MRPKTPISELPLRERKKEMIRRAIMENAERLFRARGYDNVTVAEVADAANISVKTLFTYFDSKEDLVFNDSWLIDTLIAAMSARSTGVSHAQAIAGTLSAHIRNSDKDVVEGLEGFHRGYGSSDSLRSRMLRLWAEYEQTVANYLAHEAGIDAPTPALRFHAIQLVMIARSMIWDEVRTIVSASKGSPAETLCAWLEDAAAQVDRGYQTKG